MPNALRNTMPKTVLLAIVTLMLAVAALVTNVVSPYTGGIDTTYSAATPAQTRYEGQAQIQRQEQLRPQAPSRMQA